MRETRPGGGALTLRAEESPKNPPPSSGDPSSKPRASSPGSTLASKMEEADAGNLLEYCSTDPRTGERRQLTESEKERIYLEAVYSYYDGKPIMSNDEFNLLKEDLQWSGSQVVVMNRDEQKFVSAAQAYYNGTPIMSDEEFDILKAKLRLQNSRIALQWGPRCNVETGVCYSDCRVDRMRQTMMYAPAAGIGALLWAAVTFELTPLRHINPVFNLLLGTPFIYAFAFFTTQLVLQRKPLIVEGECPTCGAEQRVFFGDILGIEGHRDVADTKCEKCKSALRVSRERMRMEQVRRVGESGPLTDAPPTPASAAPGGNSGG